MSEEAGTRFGARMIAGLKDLLAYERGEDPTAARVVVRSTPDLALLPPPLFPPERIRAIRRALGLSEWSFATVMTVTPETVALWERGRRQPGGAALRLLQMAEQSPERFTEYLRELPAHGQAPRAG